MGFDDMLDYCSAEAIATKLEPTAESTWRKICRTYSKKFNTSLPDVMKLNPEEVALNVFEDNLDQYDEEEHLEQLLDLIYTLDDPEYLKQKEEELQTFIDVIEEEETRRVKEGRPIHPALKSETTIPKKNSQIEKREENSTPTGGAVDLSHLDKDENER